MYDLPDARQELSIEMSDPCPEAEKMLRRLSAGASANSHSLKHAAAPAAMLAFSVLPTKGLTSLWTTPAGRPVY